MSFTTVKGDLLKQESDAIINTVNCIGVMGKGIALQFKRKWPENYKAYAAACKLGQVQIGKMFVYDLGSLFGEKPRYIINFPTKNHWNENSKLSYIEDGLNDLARIIEQLGIKSISIPPLGCGNGGLNWHDVKIMIEKILLPLENKVDMRLLDLGTTPKSTTMETRTPRPQMTIGRAILIKLISAYSKIEDSLSRLEIQKLCYFMQEAGEPLRLNYVKNQYGPYADNLRHVLNTIEGHFIKGVGDHDTSMTEITLMPKSLMEASTFLKNNPVSNSRIDQVMKLIDGFEGPYGMELLATVHWVCTKEPTQSLNQVIKGVYHWQDDQPKWNERKQIAMSERDIEIAWNHLDKLGWIKKGMTS